MEYTEYVRLLHWDKGLIRQVDYCATLCIRSDTKTIFSCHSRFNQLETRSLYLSQEYSCSMLI